MPGAVDIVLLSIAALTVAAALSMPVAAWFLLRRPPPPADGSWPRVSILKPIKGVDEEAEENFRSYLDQDYPDFEVIFAILDAADPVRPILERLREGAPPGRMQIVIGGPAPGLNAKARNLQNAYAVATGEAIVVNDSDTRAPGRDYLRLLVSTLAKPECGAVTVIPVCLGAENLPAACESLGMNGSTLGIYAAQGWRRSLDFGIGATLAFRREALEAIGGFAAVGDCIADDHELGHLIFRSGRRVLAAPFFMPIILHRYIWSAYLRHVLRWGRTIRAVRPGVYALAGLLFGLPSAAAFALIHAVDAPLLGVSVVAATLGARLFAVGWLNAFYYRDRATWKYLWLLPVNDLLMPFGWLYAWFGSTVEWRGAQYRIGPRGVLRPVR
ncbi:MAG: glycosyltransferase [Planctomycetes bacterium]|nr:glycosyltransferase [Planctomycetota bacterium]